VVVGCLLAHTDNPVWLAHGRGPSGAEDDHQRSAGLGSYELCRWEALVTAGPWDPRAACATGHSRLRASDADRERVIDTLKAAFVQGRLTRDELGRRTGQALASRTYGELTAITADIPARRVEALPQPKTAQRHNQRRADKKAVAWAICMLLLPTTLGAAFVTYYVGFLVLFMLAFIGVTVTAQP
jgi:Domain of unknown function (DUF1707)